MRCSASQVALADGVAALLVVRRGFGLVVRAGVGRAL